MEDVETHINGFKQQQRQQLVFVLVLLCQCSLFSALVETILVSEHDIGIFHAANAII